jgi:predicted transcriptional regulator
MVDAMLSRTVCLRSGLTPRLLILKRSDSFDQTRLELINSMADRVVTAHIPEALARDVDQIAERLDRPRGWIVKEALARYVELERKRHELTLDALTEVDAGRVIDHAAVEAWAAKVTKAPLRKRRR